MKNRSLLRADIFIMERYSCGAGPFARSTFLSVRDLYEGVEVNGESEKILCVGQAVDSRQTSECSFFACNGINVLPINNRTGHLFLFIVVVKKSKVFEGCSESFVIKDGREVNTLKDFFVTFQKLSTTPNLVLSTRAIGGT